MMRLPAGDSVVEMIELARHADQPVLLAGRHGVGKSSLFEEAARRQGIDIIVRDLSLMEPVDLIGIPRINDDGRTEYHPPSFLPCKGEGLLVIEELNRCPRYVQVPCLQLLTDRRLNDYALPPGWLPCAAINDGEQYLVDELDDALTSRFVQVRIEPDSTAWATWARHPGNVHDKIVDFVEQSPGVFDDPQSNPRAWTYASNLLKSWEELRSGDDALAVALAGVVGETWAVAFLEYYGTNAARPLQPQEITEDYLTHRGQFLNWINDTRLDLVSASLDSLQKHLQRQRDYEAVAHDPEAKRNVEQFLFDLPPDLRRLARGWLKDRGFHELKVPRKSRL
ncbi:AAA domain (dynein-related subfamily) [Bremerella volcania]|uniref:AAA domain (Dynein-related subfamily) n=1 Tax=Bremerella volcania TaxID=2527984 RepID=A0A518C605_9BACT|nr:AAA family ATPase [Bremerella volcania]QDU74641.1 AAA domain (dynein-related subfamily) [Bremerella volcania]